MKDFKDLPFKERPDLSPYLIHLTKNTANEDSYTAFDNLVNILKGGNVWGSGKAGYIKGPHKATCFMDVPFSSLKYILNEENCNFENPRYEPYGLFITKKFAYKRGVRPVLYLSDQEVIGLGIPDDEIWRVVRFEVIGDQWISWLHEREWRCKGDFKPPTNSGVLVKTAKEAMKLHKMINEKPNDFKIHPKIILPLEIICQGLPT